MKPKSKRDPTALAVAWPQWRPARFVRLAGFADTVLHKVELSRQGETPRLRGAAFVKMRCRLLVYRSELEAALQQALAPLAAEYGRLQTAAARRPAEPPAGCSPSLWRVRAAQAAAAEQAQAHAAAERAEALRTQIDQLMQEAAFRMRAANEQANAEIVRFSKATLFRPIEEEIPQFDIRLDLAALTRRCGLPPAARPESNEEVPYA